MLLGTGVLGVLAPTAQGADTPAGTTAADTTPADTTPADTTAAGTTAAPDHLVISAVFGSDGGAFSSDWVQLYNPTDQDISLGTIDTSTTPATVTPSYYQCYRGLSATTCSSMKLYGTVRAHHYFLIWNGHNADTAAGSTRGVPPADVTPDLDFARDPANTAGSSTDPSGQSNTGFGGYSSGGQILLLDATSGGTYAGSGDLSSAEARAAGVVDAVAWTKYASSAYTQPGSAETNGATTVVGASAGTSNAYVSVRTFTGSVPQDTDRNSADFTAVASTAFTLHSQISDHVAVAPVADTEVSRGEAMKPLQVQGSKGTGALTYAAEGLPGGVTIDPATGVISGTPSATDELRAYPVTVTVSDSTPTGAETASVGFTLTLTNTLSIEPLAKVAVRKGSEITPIQVSAHGGTPAYHYAATGLPAGLALDPATGVISGTPTDVVASYGVHVTVTDSGAPAQSATSDLTVVVRPKATSPEPTGALAGLRINEVHATGTPSADWVELVNTGTAITGAALDLVDGDGHSYHLAGLDLAAGGYAVVDGSDLDAAGVDLAASDTLDVTDADDVVVDETSWSSYAETSWSRYPDGTGSFAVSKQATRGAANAVPAAYATDHLVIAGVFGANSDSARWSNDWVELYNPTDQPVSLGTIDTSTTPSATVTPNYALCYRTYASTGGCSTLVRLFGTVAPHHHYFVWYANAHTPADHGTYPAGFTPDLDVSVKTPENGNQSGSNMGGCNTGGQIQLLDATKRTTPLNGDLSTDEAKAAGVVDGVGWMNASTNQPAAAESKGSATLAGLDSGTNNACVIARRFADGYAVDSDVNNSDFTPIQSLDDFTPHSQHDDRVAVTEVPDTEISLNEAMDPIRVEARAIFGDLTFSASGLPAGLAIDPATGVISGTPDASVELGEHPVTVTVGDGVESDTTTTTFTLTVSKVLRLAPLADVSVHQGAPLTDVRPSAHGGTPPYTFSATGLPAGVSIDPTTGVISGAATDALGSYDVAVTVTDSATGDAHASVTQRFTLVELPRLGGPSAGDPLAGLRLNEVRATGTPAQDWVEVYNTGDAVTGAALRLEDARGETYELPARDVAAHGYAVVDGDALAAAGLDLTDSDTLYLAESDGTLLDQTTWTSYAPTSWGRTTDGAGDFAVSAWTTKGAANSGAPEIEPNDLLVSEVNYDNNSTDYFEYSEVTNTTDHPIDFAAYGLTMTKSGAVMSFHDPSDTTQDSPVVDPVIQAHGTQVFWWVENQYLGVKTTAQFRSNYGLAPTTPVVLVFGFSSMANSGGDHSYYLSVNRGSTLITRAYVDTPCAANTLNGSAVCPATNKNYAEHYAVPADHSSADAAVWYNSLAPGGDSVGHPLKPALSNPGKVDLEQPGYTRKVTISAFTSGTVTLTNTSSARVDLSEYVLEDEAGTDHVLPHGTEVAPGADLVIPAADSGLARGDDAWVMLLAPRGYAYTDGVGLVDTTGPILRTLPYDASTGGDPVIDETTGLPLPPAGGLYRPGGISAADGKVYVSNTGDNVVASLADGSSTPVAGSLAGYGDVGDEGPAVDALLYQPGGTAVDAAGNLYIADSGDNVIRRVTTDGVIHRFAGTGHAGGAGAEVTATSTPLSVNLWHPDAVAVDSHGNVLIADTFDHRVLEVTPAGAITVVAGTGTPGYTGDGGAASSARLAQPAGIAVDAQDDVYIADSSNNVIRRVDGRTGVITTVAGDYAAAVPDSCLGAYAGDGGPATSARLNDPQGVALDGAGNLFIADTFNHAIRQVTPDGTISTLVNVGGTPGPENAGAAGVLPWSAQLNTPYAVAVDRSTKALYIADTKNNSVAEVLHAAEAGNGSGPLEPADQVAVTGSGEAANACASLRNGPVVATKAPRISGTAAVGSTLTVDAGGWTPTPDSFTYQWLRDGVAIDGATKATYTATTADAGHALTVSVTAVKEEFAPGTATTAPVSVPVPTLSPGTPSLSGSFQVGGSVSVDPGTWKAGSAAVTSFTFQWLRGGAAIPGATVAGYTLTPADYGATISVRVTGAYPGYASASVTSAAHAVAPGTLTTSAPRIKGAARVGRRLTAKAGTWRAGAVPLTGAHLAYQWYAGGKRIRGATHATFRIGRKYRHRRITVTVTGSFPGYATVTRWSRRTAVVKGK